jgi:hypothetical protein
VLERKLSGVGEEDVDDDALGGREQDLVDQFLLFVNGRCRRRRASSAPPAA